MLIANKQHKASVPTKDEAGFIEFVDADTLPRTALWAAFETK